MCVTTKRVLKKLGGDKIPSKVYTFNGDASGKHVFGNAVKISDDAPDLKKATKLVITYDDGTAIEFSPDVLTFEENPYLQGFLDPRVPETIFAASVHVGDDETPAGLYVINEPSLYISRIEFAETIVPIDPKYLPGVCLPVVELSTAVTAEGATLTAEESAKMDAVGGHACVIKCTINMMEIEIPVEFVCTGCALGDVVIYTAVINFGDKTPYYVAIGNEGAGWVASINA